MISFVIAAIAGVGIGVLSGLLGIGGGTVMVPLFRLAFGMQPIVATATSLFTIVPTSISGMWKHHKNKTSLPRVGVVCGIAGACLSPIGVWAASVSPGWAIMGAAACVVAYSSYTMFKKALKAPRRGKAAVCAQANPGAANAPAGASSAKPASVPADVSETPAFAFSPAVIAKIAFIGIVAGFMSGYVGVGGGFIMVPLFVSMLGIPMRLASGTSLTAVCILAVPGVIEQGMLGNIDCLVGVAMMVGSIPGAVLGANLVKRVPERELRFMFAGFLLLAAALLVLNEAGVL